MRMSELLPLSPGYTHNLPRHLSGQSGAACPTGCLIKQVRLKITERLTKQVYRVYHGVIIPRCSMYGIFTNINSINDPNVGKYSIHEASGIGNLGSRPGHGTLVARAPGERKRTPHEQKTREKVCNILRRLGAFMVRTSEPFR